MLTLIQSFLLKDQNTLNDPKGNKTCKAANIQGKYKTIAADDEILDKMYRIVSKKICNFFIS